MNFRVTFQMDLSYIERFALFSFSSLTSSDAFLYETLAKDNVFRSIVKTSQKLQYCSVIIERE